MATANKTAANQIVHDNFLATLAPIVRPVSFKAVYITVTNKSTVALDDVGISFDGGTTFYSIGPSDSFSFEIWGIKDYVIKGLVNPVSVQCLYGLEA